MLTEQENNKPLELLKEVEAFLALKLTCDNFKIDRDCAESLVNDIRKCLNFNKTDF